MLVLVAVAGFAVFAFSAGLLVGFGWGVRDERDRVSGWGHACDRRTR